MKAISRAYYIHGVDLGPLKHLMVSPPPRLYHLYDYPTGYQQISKITVQHYKELGMIAGCLALHQVRGPPWKITQYKKHEVELPNSWHYHAIGFIPDGLRMSYAEFNEKTGSGGDGWIVKDIPIINQEDGAREALKYEMNHAAFYQGKTNSSQIIKYFGACSYTSAKCDLTIIKTEKTCKECGDTKNVIRDGMFVCEAYKKEEIRKYDIDEQKLKKAVAIYKLKVGNTHHEKLDV